MKPVFHGVIYPDSTETTVDFDFQIKEGKFDTLIDGGYSTAQITIQADYLKGYPIAARSLFKHFVIYDSFGTRVYEGKIGRINNKLSSVGLDCLGYYSLAQHLTMQLLYLTPGDGGVATSISDIIEDAISLVSGWRQYTIFITQTTTDITPQDFTGEAKIKDAIEGVLYWGDDNTPPNPLHFQIWDYQTPYLVVRSDRATDSPEFMVSAKTNIGDNISTIIATESIFNKIQVLYDDPSIGQDFTSWYQDAVSQELWGIREGSYTLGETTADLAGLVGELALENYKDPQKTISLQLRDLASFGYNDNAKPLYKLRANDVLRIVDIPSYMIKDFGSPSIGFSDAQEVVTKTSYSIGSDTMSVSLGGRLPRFEALMTRLGLGIGDVT